MTYLFYIVFVFYSFINPTHIYGCEHFHSFFPECSEFPYSLNFSFDRDYILSDSLVQELCLTRNTYTHDLWNFNPYIYYAYGKVRIKGGWILLFYRTTEYSTDAYACTYSNDTHSIVSKVLIYSDTHPYKYYYKTDNKTITIFQSIPNGHKMRYKYKLDLNFTIIKKGITK